MRVEQIKEAEMQADVARSVRVPARAPRWVIPTVKASLLFADILLACASFLAAFYLREGDPILAHAEAGRIIWSEAFAPYCALLLFVLPIRLLAQTYYDLYRLRGEFSFLDDSTRVFKATAIGSLLIVAAAFLYRGGFAFS